MSEYTQVEFQQWCKEYLFGLLAQLKVKGAQYSKPNLYALHNFREAAKVWQSTEAYQIMQVVTKHWVLLVDKAEAGRLIPLTPTEKRQVEESARDMIIYMLLLIFGQLS